MNKLFMAVKKVLRRRGFDIVRYHSFWDDVAVRRGYKTILDIGANDGSSAKALRQRFPEATIYSFEPLHESFQKLTQTMAGDAQFHGYNMALGEQAGTSVIHRSSSNPSSSLLPMGDLHKKLYPGSATHIDEIIRVARLDDVLQSTSLEKPVLAKIDVQGFEGSVIKGGARIFSGVDTVLVENSFVSLYDGQLLFGDIHDLLRGLGFSYRGRSETHYNTKTGEPIYEDSVFIRDTK